MEGVESTDSAGLTISAEPPRRFCGRTIDGGQLSVRHRNRYPTCRRLMSTPNRIARRL